jgi:ribosome maturation factor RimP
VGRRPAFFLVRTRFRREEVTVQKLQQDIERKLEELDPAVELIALEKAGPEALRLYVDHPEGVDLGLCERVSRQLAELTADWAIEVSSPGLDRPLTKQEHYQRFLGSKVRVRTKEAVEGRRSFTGTLATIDADTVGVEDEGGVHQIPLAVVHRSNLVPEFSEVSP